MEGPTLTTYLYREKLYLVSYLHGHEWTTLAETVNAVGFLLLIPVALIEIVAICIFCRNDSLFESMGNANLRMLEAAEANPSLFTPVYLVEQATHYSLAENQGEWYQTHREELIQTLARLILRDMEMPSNQERFESVDPEIKEALLRAEPIAIAISLEYYNPSPFFSLLPDQLFSDQRDFFSENAYLITLAKEALQEAWEEIHQSDLEERQKEELRSNLLTCLNWENFLQYAALKAMSEALTDTINQAKLKKHIWGEAVTLSKEEQEAYREIGVRGHALNSPDFRRGYQEQLAMIQRSA